MLLEYQWPGLWGEEPGVGVYVELSGDPDAPVLRGVIARVAHPDDEPPVLSILMQDGQDGAQQLQEWIENDGEIGLARAIDQSAGSGGLLL